MSSLNVRRAAIYTAEGAKASHINPQQQLRRLVMSCLLWEDGFYTDGKTIAQSIADTIPLVDPQECAQIAWEARNKHHLRHVGLHIVREMARLPRHKRYVSRTLQNIIQRPDELTEFLAIYWCDNKQPLSAKVKQGLAYAFRKFDKYSLAKYNRTDKAIKLRDVLFLVHAKPKDEEQAALWKCLVDNELVTPDTWEVSLSSGADKAATFTRLMSEAKLGGMAFIRNLRNMREANVDQRLMEAYGLTVKLDKILPFRFISAAKTNLQLEPMLEQMLFRSLAAKPKIMGKTVILIDVSGSMRDKLSRKSEVIRTDAACGLAILLRELCYESIVYTFSDQIVEIPARRGFALRDACLQSQPPGGTNLGGAINWLNINKPVYDRLIVITDEQSSTPVSTPMAHHAYIINVASERNGIGYGQFVHINGFSASTIEWLQQYEADFLPT